MGSIQLLSDVLKEVFVQVAVDEISKSNQKLTVSRISCMTGLHRNDVAKIFRGDPKENRTVPDVVTRVIGQWEQDKTYRGSDGKPKKLSFKGQNSDFTKLVSKVSKSIGAAAVLFELERVGAVEKQGNKLKLTAQHLQFTGNYERSIDLASRNVHTIFDAIDENIEGNHEIPHLMLRTEYDNILIKELPKIRAWFDKEGKKFHQRARLFLAKYDQDISPVSGEPAGAKVTIGSFSFIEPGTYSDSGVEND
ncbi:MAG: hypothetical protein KDD66_16075 [Bdellovibrionales bacterium]|nr:hypothetical protein [Bdellovibrionales bacterium]